MPLIGGFGHGRYTAKQQRVVGNDQIGTLLESLIHGGLHRIYH